MWIPQASLGFIEALSTSESVHPRYLTKKVNFGIVIKKGIKDLVKVAFRENLDMQLFFKATDLRKPNTEGNHGKIY